MKSVSVVRLKCLVDAVGTATLISLAHVFVSHYGAVTRSNLNSLLIFSASKFFGGS
ncbi:hypothetical protein Poly51_53920 [Rubripirellula tenax]|uniref:Uncharacterized protein n=1 Tax=Rubripirellula tenax TaxID=2528015 RepID=A0A5C6EEZ0_9BACT|nr:hypothetical protein Poly51_53920 [Rubripirellula tenax]